MEREGESRPVQQPVFHGELSRNVISEVDLLAVLNISYDLLRELRHDRGFPAVLLNRTNRLYMIKDVVSWLDNRAKMAQ